MRKPELSDLRYNTIGDEGNVVKNLEWYIEDLEEYITKYYDYVYTKGFDDGHDEGLSEGLRDIKEEESNGK